MAQIKVSEFVVEVSFAEKVTQGLEKLDRLVNGMAVKWENKLDKVFSKDFSRNMQATFNRIDQSASKLSRNINRNLTNAFNVRPSTRTMFGNIVSDAQRVSREANRALNGIGRNLNVRLGGSAATNGGRRRGAAPDSPDTFQNSEHMRLYQRFQNSAQMRRLEMAGGQQTMYARQVQSRAANAMVRFGNDTNELRRYFALLQHEVREHTAATRRDTAETRRHAQQESRADHQQGRRSGGFFGFGRRGEASGRESGGLGAMGVMAGGLAANAVTFAVGKALDIGKEAYKQGVERSQAKTMMGAAFGDQSEAMQKGVAALANKYGANQTDLMREISVQRNTMPRDKFSNEQLLKNAETMSVFSHATGVNQEAVGRANYAISQIAGSSKINKQDINQLTNAIPEALTITAKAMGKSKEWLIKNMKDLKPEVVLDNFYKGMEGFNVKTGAAVKAQNSIQAQQGRMMNAWNNDLVAMFEGSGSSLGGVMDKITKILVQAEPIFRGAGAAAAGFFDSLSNAYERTDFKGMGDAFKNLFNSLPKDVQGQMSDLWHQLFDDPFKGLPEAAKAFTDFINGIANDIKVLTGKGTDKENAAHPTLHRISKAIDAPLAPTSDQSKWFEKPAPQPKETPEAYAARLGVNGKVVAMDNMNSYLSRNTTYSDTAMRSINNPPKPIPVNGDINIVIHNQNGEVMQTVKAYVKGSQDQMTVQASPVNGGWNKGFLYRQQPEATK